MLGKNLAHIKIYKVVSMISTGAITKAEERGDHPSTNQRRSLKR